MTHFERQSLILSMSELQRDDETLNHENEYASAQQAFYDQSLLAFIFDEVHAMMQILCCEVGCLATFYNPLYFLLFWILFTITFPGAFLHWCLLCCIPVRYREYPEERELRSQGIYAAIGIAMLNIPFAIAGLFLNEEVMVMINSVSLGVNVCMIMVCLIGLKAITDELLVATRVFIIGVWMLDLFLIGLLLFDVYQFLTLSWETVAEFILRIFQIFIYTVVGAQTLQFWNMYTDGYTRTNKDALLATCEIFFISLVVWGFVYALVVSQQNAWKIMYW
jgi:hypothetical protein